MIDELEVEIRFGLVKKDENVNDQHKHDHFHINSHKKYFLGMDYPWNASWHISMESSPKTSVIQKSALVIKLKRKCLARYFSSFLYFILDNDDV